MKNSGQFKKGIIPWNKGKKMSDDYKKKISKSTKLAMNKPEIKEKISGKNNSMYGKKSKFKKHTLESRLKISEKLKGVKHPNYGKHLSNKTKNNISKSLSGKHYHTEESKEKIRKHRLKQVFPLKTTLPERKIRSLLSVNGIEYSTHKPILGQPDIFIEPNICIFVDGCYWHGCEVCGFNNEDKNNKDFNITNKLKNDGYVIIRIWEHEMKDMLKCLDMIRGEIF